MAEVTPLTLDVHFLGGSEGESIVVRFPDGKWGVVDAYTPNLQNPAVNPTVAFLAKQGVTDLAFVCLTHPHADHYAGLRQILEDRRWKVHAVWRSAILPQPLLMDWLTAVREWRERSRRIVPLRHAEELTELFRYVKGRKDLEKCRFQIDGGSDLPCKRLLPHPPGLPDSEIPYEISLFAPSGRSLERYENEVTRALERENPESIYNQANDVSVGLLIRYGATRVVLSGDISNRAWKDLDHHQPGDHPPLRVVKVPHHGSRSSYTEARWVEHCTREHTIAVIFPFRRHRLPRPESRAFFEREAARVLYTTNPAPPIPLATSGDVDDLVAMEAFKAHPVKFASGRWSLSLDADGRLVSAIPHGDATENNATPGPGEAAPLI